MNRLIYFIILENNSIYFVIPTRKGSKGFPLKNRKLIDFTLSEIPSKFHEKTIVTTNDEEIIKKISNTKIKILKRKSELCGDDISIRDVMIDVVEKFQLRENDIIVMLYVTYLGRKFEEIMKIVNYFLKKKVKTLTCCVEPKSHPYLCLYKKPVNKGEQVIKHDLYRRQDYPEVIELRHYVCIFQVNEVQRLNKNMYNENTIFYKITNDIDIDYEEQFMDYMSALNDE